MLGSYPDLAVPAPSDAYAPPVLDGPEAEPRAAGPPSETSSQLLADFGACLMFRLAEGDDAVASVVVRVLKPEIFERQSFDLARQAGGRPAVSSSMYSVYRYKLTSLTRSWQSSRH